jgi:WD40 repeat protein
MLKYALLVWLLWSPMVSAAEYLTLPGLNGYARFSQQSDQVLRLADRRLEIWGLSQKKALRYRGSSAAFVDAQFSPDGAWLISGSEEGEYTLWRSRDLTRIQTFRDPPSGESHQPFAISPDGQRLAICKLSTRTRGRQTWLEFYLHLWDIHTGQRTGRIFVTRVPDRLPGHLPTVSVAWHPLGRYLTTALEWDEGIRTLEPQYLQVRDTWRGRWRYWVPGAPPTEYSANGKYFAFLQSHVEAGGELHWQIKLWHTPTNRLKTVTMPFSLSAASGLTLSPAGDWLACIAPVSRLQKQVIIYNTRSLKPWQVFRIPDTADSLSFSPDQRRLMVSSFADPTFVIRIYPLKLP